MTNGVRLRRASKTFSVLLVVANASETVTMKLGRNFCPSLRKAAQIRTLWQGSGPLSSLCKAWLACLYIEQGCLSPYMEYCWRHYDNATVTSTVSIYGDILLSPYIEICPNYMEYCWRHYDNATMTSTVSIYGDVVLSPLSIYRDVPKYADVVGLLIYWAGLNICLYVCLYCMSPYSIWRCAHMWRCGAVSIYGDVPIYGELLTSDKSIMCRHAQELIVCLICLLICLFITHITQTCANICTSYVRWTTFASRAKVRRCTSYL